MTAKAKTAWLVMIALVTVGSVSGQQATSRWYRTDVREHLTGTATFFDPFRLSAVRVVAEEERSNEVAGVLASTPPAAATSPSPAGPSAPPVSLRTPATEIPADQTAASLSNRSEEAAGGSTSSTSLVTVASVRPPFRPQVRSRFQPVPSAAFEPPRRLSSRTLAQ